MNWLQSLFQHNKAWIVPVAAAAAAAAGASLTAGQHDPAVVGTAIGGAILTTAAALTRSPLVPAIPTAAQQVVEAVVQQAASNVASGAPLGTQAVATAVEQVAKDAVEQAVTGSNTGQ